MTIMRAMDKPGLVVPEVTDGYIGKIDVGGGHSQFAVVNSLSHAYDFPIDEFFLTIESLRGKHPELVFGTQDE